MRREKLEELTNLAGSINSHMNRWDPSMRCEVQAKVGRLYSELKREWRRQTAQAQTITAS